jgi:transcriptional regulator with XRE-family HTH domain
MVGKKIKEFLNEKGMKQKKFCELTGIKPPHLTQVIKGNGGLSFKNAAIVAKVIGCSLDDFVDNDKLCGERWLETGKP